MNAKASQFFRFLKRIFTLVRPYGLTKPIAVFAIFLLQGLLQVAGVTSVFPFLAIASDPQSFRLSSLGQKMLALVPEMSDARLLISAGIFSIAVLLVSNAANLLSDYARFRYAYGLGHWLRLRLMMQVAAKPWSFFLQTNTAILLKKVIHDVRLAVENVLMPLLECSARLITSILLIATLLLVDFRVAVGSAVILGGFYVTLFYLLRGFRGWASFTLMEADRGGFKEAQQLFSGIKPAKLHAAENFFTQRYAVHSAAQARVSSLLPLFVQTPKYLLEPAAFGGLIAVVVFYASMGRSFTDLLPTLGVIALAAYRLLPSLQMLYAEASRMMASRYAVDEVYAEFESSEQEAVPSIAPVAAPIEFKQAIRAENLRFAYDGSSSDVLAGLNFELAKNRSLGVVGPTGSGKSTLVDLILGLHRPSGGRITIDGKELTPERMRAWQATVGYVPQDIYLTDETIARNIAFGLPDEQIDLAQLKEAARAAQILDFIENELPEGFQTIVGERGVRLSGGQRQRIALARALYRKPQLLVLDEATSALDNETEAAVVQAINQLQGEITMIVVAHRLSTIERCNQVLTLGETIGPVTTAKTRNFDQHVKPRSSASERA